MTETQNNTVDAQVVKQIEFYFSNSNLPNDHFLRNLYTADPENGVELSVIATFKRMRMITEDIEVIRNALREHCKLPESNILLTTDDTKVTRKESLPEFVSTAKQSIALEKLPLTVNIDEIETYINSILPSTAAGKVKCVRLNRNAEKTFSGVAFVELANEADAEELAKLETLEWKSVNEQGESIKHEVTICTRPIYIQRLKAESGDKRGKKRKNDEVDNEQDKKMKSEENSDVKSEETAEPAEPAEPMPEIIPDLLIKFDSVGGETTRESLRDFVVAVGGDVGYVDFSKGENEAVVRLVPESVVKAAGCVERIKEQSPELDGIVPSIRTFSTEEESAYMEAVHKRMLQKKYEREQDKKNRRNHRGGGGRGRRGGFRGGRGRGRGGRRSNRD
jgi:lupus La protein